MEVLQVIDTLKIGGAEKVMVQLSNLLVESNIKTEILITGSDGNLKFDINPKIKIHYIIRKNKFDISIFFKTAKLLRHFDIIHVHMRHNYRYIKFIQTLFSLKKKIIFHDHYGSINLDKRIPFGFKSLTKPKFYIGVSHSLTDWALESLKMDPARVYLLENTITPLPTVIVPQKKGFVLVGNIKTVKNQLFAINLMKRINENLTIFGQIQEKVYMSEIISEIKKENLNNRITFIHNQPNIQLHLPNFELGLNVSKSESGPLILLEYLAQGIPFLSYNSGSIASKLCNFFPEFFIDNFNIENWVDRIHTLQLKTPDIFKMKQVLDENFSEQNFINKCLKIYKDVENF